VTVTYSMKIGRRLRAAAILTVACGVLAAGATAAGTSAASEVVACYDPLRKIVTHTLSGNCAGEVITPQRESELAAQRRERLQSSILARTAADPVTGTRRLVGTGSGFYVAADGSLLTNHHVVGNCDLLTATPDDGSKALAQLIATSAQPDIALLRTTAPAAGIAKFSALPQRVDGRRLAVVGYPSYGLPTRLSTLSPAQIEPSLLTSAGTRVQFNGEIRHGNSGSPLLDAAGNVLGIVFATVDTPKVYAATHQLITGIGVAVPYRATLEFLTAHGVEPQFASPREAPLSPDDLHDKSRRFVVQIGCWR
jgi:serine protease Do